MTRDRTTAFLQTFFKEAESYALHFQWKKSEQAEVSPQNKGWHSVAYSETIRVPTYIPTYPNVNHKKRRWTKETCKVPEKP